PGQYGACAFTIRPGRRSAQVVARGPTPPGGHMSPHKCYPPPNHADFGIAPASEVPATGRVVCQSCPPRLAGNFLDINLCPTYPCAAGKRCPPSSIGVWGDGGQLCLTDESERPAVKIARGMLAVSRVA